MSHGSDCQETTFAYLSTLESVEHGYFGGYLVLSKLGRPLEFHCTAPIRPSRAQQILYGPTLEPYLLGEQICGALLHAAKLKPSVILTDREAVLYVRARTAAPIVLVTNSTAQVGGAIALQAPHDASNAINAGSLEFTFGACELQLPFGYERDQNEVVAALTILTQHVDLAEPFERIHEAIREAQRIGGRGTEANDQAA